MKICMIVPQADVKGGIATVVNGYRKLGIGKEYDLSFVESYCDGSKAKKLKKACSGYGKFVKELLFHKPDIVHIHSSFGPSFYRKLPFIYLARWRGIRIINHIHGAEFDAFYVQASKRKRKWIEKAYAQCDVLVVLSEEWKERIGTIVSADKIEVIENYCHIPELKEELRKKQILFLGEIGERKGCYDLPKIYEKIVQKVGEIPLIIAGDGEVERLKKDFLERKLLDKVSFPGWIRGEEKERMLQESTFFLFPSYNEGMPMAVLEAMAYGLGIVTGNVGGIPKLIEDGVSGYLCVPGDIDGISDKMITLILQDEHRKLCGKNARKKAMEEYSFEAHTNKIRTLYESL